MDTARKPYWLRAKLPSGPGYNATRTLVDEQQAPHRLPERAMPQPRRMLVPRDSDADDPRQHLHALLQFLRDRDRPAHRTTISANPPASPTPSPR
ncbi:MAG: hypothetical protein QM760_04925 [Nibricoccus sp.]